MCLRLCMRACMCVLRVCAYVHVFTRMRPFGPRSVCLQDKSLPDVVTDLVAQKLRARSTLSACWADQKGMSECYREMRGALCGDRAWRNIARPVRLLCDCPGSINNTIMKNSSMYGGAS